MKQPPRSRENSQRVAREELAPASGFGRMAELGALATAASAMAIGVANAREHQAPVEDQSVRPTTSNAENAGGLSPHTEQAPRDAGSLDHATTAERAALPDNAAAPDHGASADTLLDPSALTARIAEQIASSVSHVLDMASGSDGTAQTLSRDIVEQAQHIAHEVHGQFAAHEPLAVLTDLVPQHVALETLGADIIYSVDQALSESGVMDLLHGSATLPDPGKIVDGIVADLHGLNTPIDVGEIVAPALDGVAAIPDTLLGGTDHANNPLAALFYDDGGADDMGSKIESAGATVSDVTADLPKLGFLAQPIDLGEELGGLTHGHNVLQLL